MSERGFASVRRRIRVGLYGACISGALMIGTVMFTGLESPLSERVFIYSFFAGMISLVILFVAARCPRCGARPFLESSQSQPYGSLTKTASLSACPRCGLPA
jgi:hypothetical protein